VTDSQNQPNEVETGKYKVQNARNEEMYKFSSYNQLLEKLVYVPRDVLKCISPKKGRP